MLKMTDEINESNELEVIDISNISFMKKTKVYAGSVPATLEI